MSQGFVNSISIGLPVSAANGGTGTAGTGILDIYGKTILGYNSAGASAVNYVQVSNSATGNGVGFYAVGTDTNISWNFYAKGTGGFNFGGSSTSQAIIYLYEQTTNGTNFVQFFPPASLTADRSVGFQDAGGYFALDSVVTPAWTDFSGTIGYTGFSGTPTTTYAYYKKINNTVFINIYMQGTSNATGFTITGLPFTVARSASFIGYQYCLNNGGNAICCGNLSGTTLTLYYGTTALINGWTNSGTKGFYAHFFYETT